MLFDSRQPAFFTRTTRPGADSGTKPAGGCAARFGDVPAKAGLDRTSAAPTAAAAAPRRNVRRVDASLSILACVSSSNCISRSAI